MGPLFGSVGKVADVFTLLAFIIAGVVLVYYVRLNHELARQKARNELIKTVPQGSTRPGHERTGRQKAAHNAGRGPAPRRIRRRWLRHLYN